MIILINWQSLGYNFLNTGNYRINDLFCKFWGKGVPTNSNEFTFIRSVMKFNSNLRLFKYEIWFQFKRLLI